MDEGEIVEPFFRERFHTSKELDGKSSSFLMGDIAPAFPYGRAGASTEDQKNSVPILLDIWLGV